MKEKIVTYGLKWATKQDLGIDDIFAKDVIYTESWCPKYNNRQIVKHWFRGMEYSWQSRCLGNQTIFPQKEIRRLWSGYFKMK